MKQFGLADLTFTLLSHPGWAVEHPRDKDGEALKLWPRPHGDGPMELSALPATPVRSVTWLDGPTLTMHSGGGTVTSPLLSGDCAYDVWEWMIAADADAVDWYGPGSTERLPR